MASHKINLEVMLLPNDSKLKQSMSTLSKSLETNVGKALGSSTSNILQRSVVNFKRWADEEVDLTKKVLESQKKQHETEKKSAAYRLKMMTTPPKAITPWAKPLPMGMLPGVGPEPIRDVGHAPGLPGVEKQTVLDRVRNSNLKGIFTVGTASLGVLTGIMGILSKVPSILQASLKILGIGVLLILKPLADLIGTILLPIGIAMIKIAGFLMKYSGGAGVGGLVGLVLGAILAVIVGAAIGAPVIILGLLVLFGAIAGAVLGSIAGAAVDWAWTGLVDIEKSIVAKILEKVDEWIGLPEEGFFGRVVTATKNWLNDPTDKQSFFGMLIKEFTGMDLSGAVKSAITNALMIQFPPAAAFSKIIGLFGGSKEAPATADGGIFNSPQVRLIGEAGPEAVIPLDKLGGMGGVSINVNGIFEESRLRDIMRLVAEDVMNQNKQVSGSVF